MDLASSYRSIREDPDPEWQDSVLMERLVMVVDAARDAWPGTTVDPKTFVRAVAACPRGVELEQERAHELWLALACAAHDRVALKYFDSVYLAEVPKALSRMALDDAVVDEVQQEVSRKLLAGEPPAILKYAGRGSMAGLIKVSAVRTALSMLRKRGREVPESSLIEHVGEADPELAFLKEGYRAAFARCFEAALTSRTSRERNLLRLHFLGKVTLEKLATMYGIHRATVVRHLAAIRVALAKDTRLRLREELGLPEAELDSVMAMVMSRMDLSMERMLRTSESGP